MTREEIIAKALEHANDLELRQAHAAHLEFMPSRFEPSGEPAPKGPENSGDGSGIDASKRYDVYCHRHGHASFMVYRNVLFKRATPLFSRDDAYARVGEFVELQQTSGQTFFVSRMSIIAFCDHGAELPAESIRGEQMWA